MRNEFIIIIIISGGQSDQGYDSLSKEEERMGGRESDSTPLVEDKGQRESSKFGDKCLILLTT